MIDQAYTPAEFASGIRSRARRRTFLPIAFLVVASGFGLLALGWAPDEPPISPARIDRAAAASEIIVASSGPYGSLLDPGLVFGPAPVPMGQNAPLDAKLQSTSPEPTAAEPAVAVPDAAEVIPPAAPAEEPSTQPSAPQAAPKLVQGVPFPMPRPPEFRLAPGEQGPTRLTARQTMRRIKPASTPEAAPDDRSFFEKLFGVRQPSAPALAYAAPQDDVLDGARSKRLTPAFGSAPATAVYDISARVVHMPNGEKLEAHSGLGDKMDDPRYVHVRMQGATPPHVYNLTERESLFHGVRAIRLHPVGGSGAIHGRAGLLAHTYLLGPKGDSNGCVSFKDYDKFLRAYLRGEVKRLVVVASLS